MSRRPLSFPGLRPKAEAERSRAKERMDELLRRAEADRRESGPVVPLSAAAELDLGFRQESAAPAFEADPAFAPPEGSWDGDSWDGDAWDRTAPDSSPWDGDLEPELGREWARAAVDPANGSDDEAWDDEAWDDEPGDMASWDDEAQAAEAWPADAPQLAATGGDRVAASLDEMPLDWIADFDDGASPFEMPAVARASRAPAAETAPGRPPADRLLRGRRVGLGHEGESRLPKVLPFRRRDRERRVPRLRRHPLLRWLRPLAVAMVILAMPLSVLAWFLASPSFALRAVAVEPSALGRVDADWVRSALGSFEGANIWLLPLARVEAVLKRHPWVGDVSLRKLPPDGLAVQIVERREAALYRSDEGLIYVDAEGRRIAPWQSVRGTGDLPILSGRGDEARLAGAVALMQEIYSAAPPWAPGLSEVEILSELDYRLHTRDLPFPLLVRAGTVGAKAHHLQAILPRILDRFETVKAVDLRFARRIIIEPVAQDPRRS